MLVPIVWEPRGYEEGRRRSPAAEAGCLTPFLPGHVPAPTASPGSWEELKRTTEELLQVPRTSTWSLWPKHIGEADAVGVLRHPAHHLHGKQIMGI